MLRYAEDNVGKRVYYRGEVVQVIEDEGDFQLRVNVTPGEYGFWEDTVFLRHDDAPVRILEDDIIAFVGRMNGTLTYESVYGRKCHDPGHHRCVPHHRIGMICTPMPAWPAVRR